MSVSCVKYERALHGSGNSGRTVTSGAIAEALDVDPTQVRKDFAGVTPSGGGEKISDKTPPQLSVKSSSQEGSVLHLALQTDKKTTKVQIYCDGKLIEPLITKNFEDTSIDLGKLSSGNHQVLVDSFDRFLNRSEQKIEVVAGK